jgi:hypothetical protein
MEQANEQSEVRKLQQAHSVYITTPAGAKEKTHVFEDWLKENQHLGEYKCVKVYVLTSRRAFA